MWVGRYVKIGYASLIKRWLCWVGLDSSKQTVSDVERGSPAPILCLFLSVQGYFEARH